MIRDKRLLAIIPARGGSKGIPRKNIVDFCGKPLIAWTIEEALKSRNIDKVIVTTDDPEIAAVARNFGADVPFLRPGELSADRTPSTAAIVHALEWSMKNHESPYPVFILLQPTSPLRTAVHIDAALEKFDEEPRARAMVSVREVSENPAWMKIVNAAGFLEPYAAEKNTALRRQDLPGLFYPNGAIYIMRSLDYLESETFFVPECSYYLMDEKASIDIDSIPDLKLAIIIKKEEIL